MQDLFARIDTQANSVLTEDQLRGQKAVDLAAAPRRARRPARLMN
jgi:hypothetical protein